MSEKFFSKVSIDPGGCHLWTASKDKNGYGGIKIAGKQLRAPRVAWEIEYGPIPKGMCVLHKCDTPACVNPEHLFLGTMADNMADKINKGRGGVGGHNAKLRLPDVFEIRKSSLTDRELSERYGVGRTTIWAVRNGQNWAKYRNTGEAA